MEFIRITYKVSALLFIVVALLMGYGVLDTGSTLVVGAAMLVVMLPVAVGLAAWLIEWGATMPDGDGMTPENRRRW